jgi:ribosomal-protein-alanine N-acetyltransferase
MGDNPFAVPVLTTDRLEIRRLVPDDLANCQELFEAIGWDDSRQDRANRAAWLGWTVASYDAHENLYQPPLGERAVVARSDGRFLGLVGYVPSFEPFARLPSWGGIVNAGRTMELGLFWVLHPSAQRQGFATEAAGRLIDHSFQAMAVGRIVATTTHDNLASVAVMRRLGMAIDHYDQPHPGLQVVGLKRADVDK